MTDLVLSTATHGNRAGRAVVALHGGGGTRRQWARIANEGLAELHWICPDLRGHGDSPPAGPPFTVEQNARDILATLDALGLADPILMGHSYGARVSIEVARRAPGRAGGLVLLDPPLMTRDEFGAYLRRHPDAVEPQWSSLDALIAELWQQAPPSSRRHAAREMLAAVDVAEQGEVRLRPGTKSPERVDDLRRSMPPSLGAFDGQVLLLTGRRSELVTTAGHRALRSQLGDRLASVALDGGHDLLTDCYDDVVDEIERWISRIVTCR